MGESAPGLRLNRLAYRFTASRSAALHDFGVSVRGATSGSRERTPTGPESAIRARFVRDSFHSLSTGLVTGVWRRIVVQGSANAIQKEAFIRAAAPVMSELCPLPTLILGAREKRDPNLHFQAHARRCFARSCTYSTTPSMDVCGTWWKSVSSRAAKCTRDTRHCLNGWQRLKRAARSVIRRHSGFAALTPR